MHVRSIGVENAGDFDRQAVLPSIIEEQGLGAALPFIVAGSQADRVDVSPVVLFLRVNRRVAVDLRCRCLQDLGLQSFGKPEHVDCPVHAHLRGLHRIELIMDWRGRASQVEDLVDLYIKWKADVVPGHLESRIRQ
jgi:hypothetical protein